MTHAMHRLPLNDARRTPPRSVSLAAQPRHSNSLVAADLVLRVARAAGGIDDRTDNAFVSAIRLYEDCHWELAFDRLATLAEQGHAPAAKLALLMLRYGNSLYGTSFSAKPEQVARWAQRVLRAASRPSACASEVNAVA